MSQKEPPFLEPLVQNMPLPWHNWFRDVYSNIDGLLVDDGIKNNIPVFDGLGGLIDSLHAMPVGAVVGTTDYQTLLNKTITAPVVNNGVFTTPTLVNPIFFGLLEGLPLELDSSLYPVNVYGHKITVVNHSSDVVLAVSDLRKLHLFDCSGGDISATLPSVGSNNIGEWVELARTGSNRLQIFAADSDKIMDSSSGGILESSDTVNSLHKIGLRLLEASRWWFGLECFGIWLTR